MVWMKVPYTNFHNLNQDWIIHRMMEFEEYMQNIVQISVIKYADPIQWRITAQYEQSTVVIDADTGIAYISVQPVPAGVAITNTNYWTPVFDLQQILGDIDQQIQEEESARTAADQTLQDNIDAEAAARAAADDTLQDNIDAEAADRAAADAALEDVDEALDARIDALEQEILETGSDHYYQEGTKREWLHINNQAEFDAMLQGFNEGYTSKSCYIESPGTYKFTGGSETGIYPVLNGIQMHIYVEVENVTIDLNCATVYTSHLVIEGRNQRVRIIDTNTYDTGRAFYPEGGTTFFTNCDFYTSITIWSGAACFSNCTWQDYKPGRNVCVDVLAGAVVRFRDATEFNITEFYDGSDGLIGCGDNVCISFRHRTTIARPATRSGYMFKPRRNGFTTILWNGSAYDPVNSRAYSSSNVGMFNAAFSGTAEPYQIFYANDQFYYVGSANQQTLVASFPYGNFPES